MLRARRVSALPTAVFLVMAAVSTHAQSVNADAALSEVSVPGGLPAALVILKEPGTPDRSQFLLEFIRRTYDMPLMSKGDPRETARQSLLMHLEAASRPSAMDTSPAASIPPGTPPAAGADTLPLPLTPAIWTKVVFGGRVAPAALLRAIAG